MTNPIIMPGAGLGRPMADEQSNDGSAGTASVVKSAGRVFEVLELFRQVRRQLSAAEIGTALGYPKSSTNALLKTLVSLGYLVLNSRTMGYLPSLSVTQLGGWIPSVVLGSGDAFEILTEIHAGTQETVTLSVQNDLSCRFLRVIPGTFRISLRLEEGYLAPLFTTAVGNAILSQLPDDEIAALVKRANIRTKKRSERKDPARLMEDVRSVRQRGYSIYYDALSPDTGAIAVPFPSSMEGFPMAIGVGGLRDRIQRNEAAILRTLRTGVTSNVGRVARTKAALRRSTFGKSRTLA
jgi:IclR family KDG regulon transcriptional repressor